MTVRIAGVEFDDVTYDERADVLYLRAAGAREASRTNATPEGHAVQLDDSGRVIGITLVNARWLVERDGRLVITIPQMVETTSVDLVGVWEAVR